MKEQEQEKSTCIDFQTDVETSRHRHIQLVESDKSLIFFNCNLCNMEFSSSDELIEIRMKRCFTWIPNWLV